MEFKDYYKTLGVSRKATDKEIKAAYRKLARKFHPDMNPNNKQAEARFKEINEANEVLSDPEKRQRYDQLGADWNSFRPPPGSGAGTGGAWPGGFRVHTQTTGEEGFQGFSDFFRTFFGGGGFGAGEGGSVEDLFGRARGGAQAPATDLEHGIDLSLEDVLRGTKRTIEVSGVGARNRRVDVKIPAGVRDNSRVRVAGEGSGVEGGARGDLYLRVRILPHPLFERKGDDLQVAVRVPLTTAVLGGEAQVPTLDGPIGIKVPPGSPAGRVFRLRGHGLPRLEVGGGRGDVLATLAVDLPKAASDRERELFEELKRLGH